MTMVRNRATKKGATEKDTLYGKDFSQPFTTRYPTGQAMALAIRIRTRNCLINRKEILEKPAPMALRTPTS